MKSTIILGLMLILGGCIIFGFATPMATFFTFTVPPLLLVAAGGLIVILSFYSY